MTLKTTLIWVLLISSALLFYAIPVFAQGVVPLTPLPDTANPGGTLSGTLQSYVPGLFRLVIGFAAVLAVVMMIIGGLEWMLADSVTNKSEGKRRIGAALGGLLLVLSSFLILQTISPNLVNFSLNIPRANIAADQFGAPVGFVCAGGSLDGQSFPDLQACVAAGCSGPAGGQCNVDSAAASQGFFACSLDAVKLAYSEEQCKASCVDARGGTCVPFDPGDEGTNLVCYDIAAGACFGADVDLPGAVCFGPSDTAAAECDDCKAQGASGTGPCTPPPTTSQKVNSFDPNQTNTNNNNTAPPSFTDLPPPPPSLNGQTQQPGTQQPPSGGQFAPIFF